MGGCCDSGLEPSTSARPYAVPVLPTSHAPNAETIAPIPTASTRMMSSERRKRGEIIFVMGKMSKQERKLPTSSYCCALRKIFGYQQRWPSSTRRSQMTRICLRVTCGSPGSPSYSGTFGATARADVPENALPTEEPKDSLDPPSTTDGIFHETGFFLSLPASGVHLLGFVGTG